MNLVAGQQKPSGWRVLIAGTGGQGVLTIARLLCDGLVARGHHVVSGQLHGMAQRGGAVQSSVIIDAGISPVIARGRADFVLGLEPVETVRAVPFMSSATLVCMNTSPVLPFVLAQRAVLKQDGAQYPAVETLVQQVRAVAPQTFAFDATQAARAVGSTRALNIVMLGCLLGSGCLPCSPDQFWNIVSKQVPSTPAGVNAAAFFKGVELVAGLRTGGRAS